MSGDATTPERVKLIVDLDVGRLAAGSVSRSLAGPSPTPDQVLATYLSLVYTVRNAEPGTPLVLRRGDLDVLAEVLRLSEPDVQRRLDELMVEPHGEVQRGRQLLRRRVLVPAVGIVVAVTALGALVLVVDRDDATPPSSPPGVVAPADVGTARTQTRNPDGSVTNVYSGEGIRAEDLAPGDVGLGSPQVAERGPDGQIVQSERRPEPATTSTTPTTVPG